MNLKYQEAVSERYQVNLRRENAKLPQVSAFGTGYRNVGNLGLLSEKEWLYVIKVWMFLKSVRNHA